LVYSRKSLDLLKLCWRVWGSIFGATAVLSVIGLLARRFRK